LPRSETGAALLYWLSRHGAAITKFPFEEKIMLPAQTYLFRTMILA
jgi:hypothetical protein